MREASYWKSEPDGTVACGLCPHHCRMAGGGLGRCGVRRNREGRLFAEAYGLISALAMDPVEKKPLYHFWPGREILSVGSAGCNMRCSFCQNWNISQQVPGLSRMDPEALVAEAREQRSFGLAYTYNEPLINFEYVLECSQRARASGLVNVMVTNGYINPEPLQELLPFIDAWNIDLKAIRTEFYRDFCGARLKPVQETIRAVADSRSHLELTHLLVTEGNDREEDVAALVDWIAEISPEIPLHLSRYFPQYRWYAPATDPDFMERAGAIARRKLAWVYLGNVAGSDDSTYCPECKRLLISRHGYHVDAVSIHDNACPHCGHRVPGVFPAVAEAWEK